MASPRVQRMEESASETPPQDESAAQESSGPVAEAPPTLAEAFAVLCEAMKPHFEDNLAAQLHCDEIQAWYQNGPANHGTAWRHAVLLLEQILNVPLRG